MKISESRVLVTGVNGVVGGWVARQLLNEGAEVTGLVRHPTKDRVLRLHLIEGEVRLRKGNITDAKGVFEAFKAVRPDAVVHLAAQASARVQGNGLETERVNVEGTVNVLNACVALGIENVVVASTGKAYGEHDRKRVTEAGALQAQSVYGASKAAMDLLSRAFAETYGLNLAVTRCGNVYGPMDLSAGRLIPSTTLKALRGRKPVINNREAKRDFVFVKDVARAYARILERIERRNVAGEAFNLASGKQQRVVDVVERIGALTGCQAKPVFNRLASVEEQEPLFSVEKAGRVLGWKAETGFSEGLARTVEWIKENKSLYRPK